MIGVVVLLIGSIALYMSRQLPGPVMAGTLGPSYFPTAISSALLVCGMVIFVVGLLKPGQPHIKFIEGSRLKFIGYILLLVAVPAGLSTIGFLLTTFFSCLVFYQMLGLAVKKAVFISLAVALAVYIIFTFGLSASLPEGPEIYLKKLIF